MHTIKQFIIFLIFITLVSIYGYLINDFFDMEIDRIQGKKNVFAKMAKLRAGLIVFFIFLASTLFGSNFLLKDYFPYLLIFLYFFATFYSAPPIRFKERGIAGLFVAFLVQYPIPIMMIFSCFDSFGTIDMWGFALFTMVSGATLEIGHQRSDLSRDSITGTKTFAVRQGHAKMDKTYKMFLLFNMISMFGILIIMHLELRRVNIYGNINVILPPLLVYIILALMVTKKIINENTKLVDPYFVEGRKDMFNIVYTLFPNCLLPFYLSCLTFVNYRMSFVFIAIFLLITFISVPIANISYPVRVVYNELRKSIGGDDL
jgi:4-hydroxybenzoate polyprenyltransferase